MLLPESDSQKIERALDAMRQLLEIQSTSQAWRLPQRPPALQRFDLTLSCGDHDDCSAHVRSIWEIIAVRYPGCRSRRYQKPSGDVFFVVLSEFSELSLQLGVAESECKAWIAALDAQRLSGA